MLRDLAPPTAILLALCVVAAYRAGLTLPDLTGALTMLVAAAALCLAGYAAITALRYRGCTTAKISLTARLVLNDRGSGRHVFVFGMTGSGKTTTVKRMLASLKPPCPVLVKPRGGNSSTGSKQCKFLRGPPHGKTRPAT